MSPKLNRPWLVAVWPGMGQIAVSAGYYLMAKLGMHQISELDSAGVFDIEHADVKDGVIQPTQLPRSRFFVWQPGEGKRDIVVFIGEAQPPIGKYEFCERVIKCARDWGVERVFTFAAMATQMHPQQDSRVFAAATDEKSLQEIRRPELTVLEEGRIGGLNGVLLGVAADKGLQGICLLGEMPHLFTQVPFPKASLEVLKVFTEMADIELDFEDLADQAETMDQKLSEVLEKMERTIESKQMAEAEEEEFAPPSFDVEERLAKEDEDRIEDLFRRASGDRAEAYALKQELDRLGVFKDYEDRFLDLFKKPD